MVANLLLNSEITKTRNSHSNTTETKSWFLVPVSIAIIKTLWTPFVHAKPLNIAMRLAWKRTRASISQNVLSWLTKNFKAILEMYLLINPAVDLLVYQTWATLATWTVVSNASRIPMSSLSISLMPNINHSLTEKISKTHSVLKAELLWHGPN